MKKFLQTDKFGICTIIGNNSNKKKVINNMIIQKIGRKNKVQKHVIKIMIFQIETFFV